jgi:hypothetical protein
MGSFQNCGSVECFRWNESLQNTRGSSKIMEA